MLMPMLFDDFFEDFAKPMRKAPIPVPQIMKTDVKESDAGYSLDIEVPGLTKENITLELKEGYLNISATTSSETNDEDANSHFIRRERFSGTSSRSFYVGEEIEETDVKAKFNNGVLSIFVPKKEKQPELPKSTYITIE